MAESRWKGPALPAATLLLLPSLTQDVRLLTTEPTWSAAAAWWGLTTSSTGTQVVTDRVSRALAVDAEVVLLLGRDRGRRLARAGYLTHTFVARRAGAGATMLIPRGRGGDAGLLMPHRRQSVRSFVLKLTRWATSSRVVLAQRTDLPPALLRAGRLGGPPMLIADGGGPRRRSALLGRQLDGNWAVVKAGRLDEHSRGDCEQGVLHRLNEAGFGGTVPRALGQGEAGRVAWTAESFAPGTPLSELLLPSDDERQVRGTLTDLARWSAALAAATSAEKTWTEADARLLPLHGPHLRLGFLFERLDGVPAVLGHRDLASAHNVLVADQGWTIIDWETARSDTLPLLDVLPLLVAGSAGLQGHRTPPEQARFVLRLCAGQEVDSVWLLACIRRYLQRARVPLSAAGTLAALTFGYQASMRSEHERLLRSAGVSATGWTTLWDGVAEGWLDDPSLGLSWDALVGAPCEGYG